MRVIAVLQGMDLPHRVGLTPSRPARYLAWLVVLLGVTAGCGDEAAAQCIEPEPGEGWRSVTAELGLDPEQDWQYVRDLNPGAQADRDPNTLLLDALVCLSDEEYAAAGDTGRVATDEGQTESDDDGTGGSTAGADDGDGDDDGGDGRDAEGSVSKETGEPEDGPDEPELAEFVPQTLLGSQRLALDPSLSNYSEQQPIVEVAWKLVAKKWKAAVYVDVVDTAVTCVYEVDAGSVGLYGGRGPLRGIAIGVVIPSRVASIDYGVCLVRETFPSIVAPDIPDFDVCGAAYRTETADGTALVAYAMATEPGAEADSCGDLCDELPGCATAAKE